jgi:endonuclease/exonuclease/phosphatase family metal-dependent hydrolase
MLSSTRSLFWPALLSLTWIACSAPDPLSPVGSSSSSGDGGTSASTSSSSGDGGAGGVTSVTSSVVASSSSSASGTGGGLEGTRLRVIAANLTSGNDQSYDPGPGLRIIEGIHADVVLMQEVNYGLDTSEDMRQITDDICGQECTMVRGAGEIPNAVISRYPILESGSWVDPKVQNRDFTWARIDIPGPDDLWAVSVHLLTSSASERDEEAAALVVQLQAQVPPGALLVMGGDFNTTSRDEAALTTLSARFSVTGPYAADGDGNDNTNTSRTKPYDWVLASPELRALETPVLVGASHFDAGLVVDTRVYTPLRDLSPAETTDSDAPNMQHMAVVRDFLKASEPVTSGGI